MATVKLKKKEERRLLSGHLWVFSNEISAVTGDFNNGDIVEVIDSGDRFVGSGFINRNSLITVRLLTFDRESGIESVIKERIGTADSRRRELGFSDTYRMVHGEADLLPGLVIDRYRDTFVLESFALGMDRYIGDISEYLKSTFPVSRIVLDAQSHWRKYEGSEIQRQLLYGSDEEDIVEHKAILYNINYLSEHKTGLFLDQSDNRLEVELLSKGKRVLDCFCNTGGFALHAARGGAKQILGIDSSATAIQSAEANARLNKYDQIQFMRADIFDYFKQAESSDQKWDMIILDPPSFVKNRKSLISGLKGYQQINSSAMRTIRDRGILVSCSCSQHVSEPLFLDMLQRSAVKAGKRISIFQLRGASKDHPILPSMPETRYLSCAFCFIDPR